MTDVTDADREKAAEIAGWPAKNWTELRDAIAVALAEERVRARAPFLALAEGLDERRDVYANAATGSHDDGINKAYWIASDRIRRAAEVTE